jgi:hypothetical protein
MGYFEALTSGSFKRTGAGERLFFPWRIIGPGYVVPSEEAFRRLHNRVKSYHIVSLLLIIVVVAPGGLLGGVVLLPLLLTPYAIWVRAECRQLARTTEKLTYRESFAAQARVHSNVGLGALELASALFVGAGLVILIVDPASWLLALAAIVFFGIVAVMIARLLIIRRRVARGNRS